MQLNRQKQGTVEYIKPEKVIIPTKIEKKTTRQKIYKYLKKNGQASWRDIVQSIPGVSTRTIQYSLREIVSLGLVTKKPCPTCGHESTYYAWNSKLKNERV